MSAEIYDLGIPRRLSRAELTLLCQQNRAWLLAYCQKRVGNQHDAEDTVQAVFEKLQRRPPRHPIVNSRVFLATVALNLIKDAARSEARSPRSASYAMELLDQLAAEDEVGKTSSLDAKRFIEMAKPMLTARQLDVLACYLALEGGVLTEQEAALELKLKPSALRGTFQRLPEDVGEAIVAATLSADDSMRCPGVTKAVRDAGPHGRLGSRINRHVKSCTVCRERQAETLEGVHKAVFVVPIGMLGTFLTLKKTASAAVVAVAAVTSALIITHGGTTTEQGVAMPVTSARIASPAAQPENTTPPPVTTSTVVTKPPVATTVSPAPQPVRPPAPPPPPPPAGHGQARAGEPPTIAAGPDAIEYRQIGTRGRCRSSTRVKVGVTAPDGVASVRMSVHVRDTTLAIPMFNLGGTWYSQVGPFPHRYAGHNADVTVEAVGRNGQSATKSLGSVAVTEC
nr:sigma factor [Kibdelosporangium sp. MJ126-NF4]CEL19117.1 sigma-70 region 2 domain protein [Kibdelosporangium sp. MJ126-NF4]CTQ95081.1 sigma-70 region 2 domain protein [Kibdelosporangium sp. MJ126-NF4]